MSMKYLPSAWRRSTSAARCFSQRSCHLASTAFGSYGVLIALSLSSPRPPGLSSKPGRQAHSSQPRVVSGLDCPCLPPSVWARGPPSYAAALQTWTLAQTEGGGKGNPAIQDTSHTGTPGHDPRGSGQAAGEGVLLEQAVEQSVDEAP